MRGRREDGREGGREGERKGGGREGEREEGEENSDNYGLRLQSKHASPLMPLCIVQHTLTICAAQHVDILACSLTCTYHNTDYGRREKFHM